MQSLPKFLFSLLPLLLAVAFEDDDFDSWDFSTTTGQSRICKRVSLDFRSRVNAGIPSRVS